MNSLTVELTAPHPHPRPLLSLNSSGEAVRFWSAPEGSSGRYHDRDSVELSAAAVRIRIEHQAAANQGGYDPVVLKLFGSGSELTQSRFIFDVDGDGRPDRVSYSHAAPAAKESAAEHIDLVA
ncbi:hypothetical protein D5085_16945 [Ectothiorhodospiraceae bacterium BW-2]|nr:hypothetical protein D5085_16945 [Ectothiorhodospiraceae bacterium BW-2]